MGDVFDDNGDNIAKHPKKQTGFFGDPAGNRTRSDRSTDREIRMFLPRSREMVWIVWISAR